jgi:hypothetical protein
MPFVEAVLGNFDHTLHWIQVLRILVGTYSLNPDFEHGIEVNLDPKTRFMPKIEEKLKFFCVKVAAFFYSGVAVPHHFDADVNPDDDLSL